MCYLPQLRELLAEMYCIGIYVLFSLRNMHTHIFSDTQLLQ